MNHSTFQSALGISTGDQVRTSYGTGGTVTHVSAPHYVDDKVGVRIIRAWPVVSIRYDGNNIINDIRCEGDRWFTDDNDEIFVTPGRSEQQMDMFASILEAPDPYPFCEEVDYTRNAWHCEQCGDFNAEVEQGRTRWHCPQCGRYGVVKLVLMQPRICGSKQLNSYLISLDYEEQ